MSFISSRGSAYAGTEAMRTKWKLLTIIDHENAKLKRRKEMRRLTPGGRGISTPLPNRLMRCFQKGQNLAVFLRCEIRAHPHVEHDDVPLGVAVGGRGADIMAVSTVL